MEDDGETAAKETRADGAMYQQLWPVAEGVTMAPMMTRKKRQSTNERRQRLRMTMAGERRGAVVKAEERLLCGQRGLHDKVMEDGGGGRVGVLIFSFLGKVESYFESYLDESCLNPNINMA